MWLWHLYHDAPLVGLSRNGLTLWRQSTQTFTPSDEGRRHERLHRR
jgi:hypothetical protein